MAATNVRRAISQRSHAKIGDCEQSTPGSLYKFGVIVAFEGLFLCFEFGILYRKMPKIRPGAYIFQRPFLRGLFLEGLMYGGKFAFQNRLG